MSLEFKPFEGSDYRQSGVRLLVVGHSHWGAQPSPTLTQDTVTEWMNNEQNISYFSKLARVLTGAEAGQVDRRASLKDIAFYNFYQSVMPERSAQPTHEQFLLATSAFPLVLNLVDPTHVLVTGITLWNDMPGFDSTEPPKPVQVGRFYTVAGRYKTPSGYAIAVGIPHMASYGFSPSNWSGFVNDFLTWS